MSEMKKISVIVPVYNGEKYIEGCLKCLHRQGIADADMEIILVNDGSTDQSLETAQKEASLYRNVMVLNKSNGGLSDTRNYGMQYAQGEYIYFIDVDDLLTENALSKILKEAFDEKADMVVFNSENVRDGLDVKYLMNEISQKDMMPGHYQSRSLKPHHRYAGLEFVLQSLESEEGFFPPVWMAVYRREFLNENEIQFEKIIHEDCVFSIDVQLAAECIVYMDEVLHRRRIVAGSITNGKKTENHVAGYWSSTLHAQKIYQKYSSDSRCRKAFRRWNVLNTWNIYTELMQCDKEIQKKYKWKYFRYVASHPYMGVPLMLLKAARI